MELNRPKKNTSSLADAYPLEQERCRELLKVYVEDLWPTNNMTRKFTTKENLEDISPASIEVNKITMPPLFLACESKQEQDFEFLEPLKDLFNEGEYYLWKITVEFPYISLASFTMQRQGLRYYEVRNLLEGLARAVTAITDDYNSTIESVGITSTFALRSSKVSVQARDVIFKITLQEN